ncbi:MAG: TetR family transcriptional regulator C-terminal domain-containing protein [Aurantibacter sp.]
MARIKEIEKEARRKELIQKGVDIILGQGYGGTGIKDITEAVGMPKGSFFNYFNSKEEYMIEAVAESTIMMSGYYSEILRDKSRSPLQRMRKLYNTSTKMISSLKFKKGCLLSALSQEASDYSDPIAEQVKESLSLMRSELESCLKEAQQLGEISKSHNIKELATFIDNSWRGTMVTSKSIRNDKAFKAFKKYMFKHVLT